MAESAIYIHTCKVTSHVNIAQYVEMHIAISNVKGTLQGGLS